MLTCNRLCKVHIVPSLNLNVVVLHIVAVGTHVFYYCICDFPNVVHKQVQPIFMLFVSM